MTARDPGRKESYRRENRSSGRTIETGKNGGISADGSYVSEGVDTDDWDEVSGRKFPKAINGIRFQKSDYPAKSSEAKKMDTPQESTETDESSSGFKACKEYIIKDDVGQVKLTKIINNSIKAAVFTIVKEGVCSLADSQDSHESDRSNELMANRFGVTQDEENKPGVPKTLASLQSSAKVTAGSQLYQCPHQPSIQCESLTPPPSSSRTSDTSPPTLNEYNQDLYPRVFREQKKKFAKQKDRNSVEAGSKVSRQTKAGSHFRTDNRRMTGNVNIYICSEANENGKDPNKRKDAKEGLKDSETASESKTSDSSLSVSTSKLLAALKKKNRKSSDHQSLSRLVEAPESLQRNPSADEIEVFDENTLCLCDENRQSELPDVGLSSSREVCLCDDTKLSDLDFPSSDIGRDSDLESSDRYTSCDKTNSCSRTSDDSPRYGNYENFGTKQQGKIVERWSNGCSWCSPKLRQKDGSSKEVSKDHKSTHDKPHHRKTIATTAKCSCIIEEEDEGIGIADKKPAEKSSPGKSRAINDAHSHREGNKTPSVSDATGIILRQSESVKADKPVESTVLSKLEAPEPIDRVVDSGTEGTESVLQGKDGEKMESSSRNGAQKSESIPVASEIFSESEAPRELENKVNNGEAKAAEGVLQAGNLVPDNKQKSSFIRRSIDRIVRLVKNRKDPISIPARENYEKSKIIPESKRKARFTEQITSNKDEEEIVEKRTILVPEHAPSKTKISIAIANRRRLAGLKGDHSNAPRSDGIPTSTKNALKSTDQGNSGKTSQYPDGPPQKSESPWGASSKKYDNRMRNGTDTRSNLEATNRYNEKPSKDHDDSSKGSQLAREKNLDHNERNIRGQRRTRNEPKSNGRYNSGQSPKDHQAFPVNQEPSTNEILNDDEASIPKLDRTKGSQEQADRSNDAGAYEAFPTNREFVKGDEEPSILKHSGRSNTPESQDKYVRGNPPENYGSFSDKLESGGHENSPSYESKIPNPTSYSAQDLRSNERLHHECLCAARKTSRALKPELKKPWRTADRREYCCDRHCHECSEEGPKPMICVYCDKPKANCFCNAPIRKCSQCGLPQDICNCKPLEFRDYNGRQIISADDNDEQTIRVTAWKPRSSVRRYFARSIATADEVSSEGNSCWDNSKPYGSDGLPYQKRHAFSDVMSELHQKISGSVYCNVCRKVQCCCHRAEDELVRDVEAQPSLSIIAEPRSRSRSRRRFRSKSPIDICKCDSSPRQKNAGQPARTRICDECRTSPCRCKRKNVSRTKPQAKCYYCKKSPCACILEKAKSRPFRNADSPRCRRKERRGLVEENINKKIDNEENGYRENNRFVPRLGNEKRMRKYCYRGSSNRSGIQHPGERVR